MTKKVDQRLDPYVALWIVQALGRWLLTLAVLLGVAILVGGELRFSGPSYVVAQSFPGAPWSWAIAALVPGVVGLVLSLMGQHRLVAWALWAEATWAAFFAYSFAHALTHSETAGSTGPITYGGISVICIILGVAHRQRGGR